MKSHPDAAFAVRQVFQHGKLLNRSRYPDTGWRYPLMIVDPKKAFTFTLATPEELQKVFGDPKKERVDPWKRFYARYPDAGGVVTLSRVGLDKARTQALVGVTVSNGGLAGAGVLVLLVKDKDAWVVRTISEIWVS